MTLVGLSEKGVGGYSVQPDRVRYACFFAWWWSVIGISPGCHPSATPVTLEGQVVYNGSAVDGGILSLLPEETGGQTAGAYIKNGRFQVYAETELRPGRYRVEIRWAKPTGEKVEQPIYGHSPDIVEQVIPAQFNDESVLSLDVGDGKNSALFWLGE